MYPACATVSFAKKRSLFITSYISRQCQHSNNLKTSFALSALAQLHNRWEKSGNIGISHPYRKERSAPDGGKIVPLRYTMQGRTCAI